MTKAKFKVLDMVVHILDLDKKPLLILGVVERPSSYTYLATTSENTENEYFEEELKKY